MLTATLIHYLKQDTNLIALLDASSAEEAPIRTGYISLDIPHKLIIVDLVYGETHALGYESGTVTIDVYVKDSINEPILVLTDIVERILFLLDLKGSQIQDSETPKVYRLRKTDFSILYDNSLHYYIGSIDFEFFVTR